MLEKPDLPDHRIVDWILDHYRLQVIELEFLPTNYRNTAAYRLVAADHKSYFLKLRRDVLDEASVTVPAFLRSVGIRQIIAPLATRSRQYWAGLDDFNVILYPFVDGYNAFRVPLSKEQWIDFGSALKKIHGTLLPLELDSRIQRETYSREWREKVRVLLERMQRDTFDEPVVAQFARMMRAKSGEIRHLVRRAEQLGSVLERQSPEFVLCHSDIHAGNILSTSAGNIFIVDWDNPILAPKERDLMFIGGGVGDIWNSEQEETFFYQGYGRTKIDTVALAYYRFERILEDIGPYSEQFFSRAVSNKDRVRILQGIEKFFLPNGVIELAYKTERLLPPELQAPVL